MFQEKAVVRMSQPEGPASSGKKKLRAWGVPGVRWPYMLGQQANLYRFHLLHLHTVVNGAPWSFRKFTSLIPTTKHSKQTSY